MAKTFVGPQLRQLRRDRKQTQAEMAKALGISAGYVNLLENNQRSLSVRLLMALADTYQVDWRDIIRDETSNQLTELRNVVRDPMFPGNPPDVQELRAAIDHAPRLVEQFLGILLHQKVHDVSGLDDHREDESADLDVQYGPGHAVALSGSLARIAGADTALVNSLHGQGVDKLGRGLVVEAVAPDGLVEAVRLDSDQTFLLAVQWHPEWKVTENPFYLGIFQEFAAACRARAALRD